MSAEFIICTDIPKYLHYVNSYTNVEYQSFSFIQPFAAKSQCHLLWMTCFNIDCWLITKCANEVFKHEHGKWILFFLQDWTPMTHRWLSHFGACWRIPMVMRGVDLQTFRCFNWLRSVVYWRTYPRCSGLIACRTEHE